MPSESDRSLKPDQFSPRAFLEQAEREDDLAALVRGTISAGLHEPDAVFAEEYCLRLAGHWHYNVRGNALQGLWHLHRRGGLRSWQAVRDALTKGLADESDYVRSQAEELAEALADSGNLNSV